MGLGGTRTSAESPHRRMWHLVLLLIAFVPTVTGQPNGPTGLTLWGRIAVDCLHSGEADILVSNEVDELYSFSCLANDERFVFMLNLDDEERRIERTGEVEPLVPIFSSSGDLAAIPSIVITLPGDGTVIHSNPIPPFTFVVFRPIRQNDIRPYGLDE